MNNWFNNIRIYHLLIDRFNGGWQVPPKGPECYHLYDYGFFFNNLKQNVADRIKAFMEKK